MDKQKPPYKLTYLQALRQRALLFDGAMGTSLQSYKIPDADFGSPKQLSCNDVLCLTAPHHVERVHRAFLEAGADVIESNTFRSNRLTLADYQLSERAFEMNLAAASLARRCADRFSSPEQPRFVAGSIGPSGKLISSSEPELNDISFTELAQVFEKQARGLIQGGVDLLLIETSNDILEVKATVAGIRRAFAIEGHQLPIQAQVSLDRNGRMLMGTDISAVLAILEGLGVDVLGLNCSTGPAEMLPAVQYLAEHSATPISILPNAGLPVNRDGQAYYPMQAEDFARQLLRFVEDYGVAVVGGCCGTRPEHIRALADALRQSPRARSPRPTARQRKANLASPIQSVSIEQEPAPFIIGERLNAQGSRAFKRLLLADDREGILAIAREQMLNGAHGLDLSVALTEQGDEAGRMARMVKLLSAEAPAALIIDCTDATVAEAALQNAPGRCLINSTNLEAGEDKARSFFALAQAYSAAVLCLTIDESGMATTVQRKLAIAERILKLAQDEFHLHPQNLVFDPLTFSLATGDPALRNSAVETLESLRLIKESFPGTHTSLGVSNISYGLSPASRQVLNSVFLYHAVQAGLDMAIVNPAQIKPYPEIRAEERKLAEDLIFNRHPAALEAFIEYFQSVTETNSTSSKSDEDPLQALSLTERLYRRILLRRKDGLEADIDALLAETLPAERSEKALDLLNNTLLPAMKEVGDRFGSGELILPFVLQSAETMKKAVSHLEQYLHKDQTSAKGKIVLATVYGDVHDIGKSLVASILANNGYKVIDMGKQVPAESIIQRAIDEEADAIGLSALLVATSQQMRLVVQKLSERKLEIPVLIGGAAIQEDFAAQISFPEEQAYPVIYCKDAFAGLACMEALSRPESRRNFISQAIASSAELRRQNEVPAVSCDCGAHHHEAHPVIRSVNIPRAPFWGARVLKDLPFDEVAARLQRKSLYRISWGAGRLLGEEWHAMQKTYDARLERMLKEAQDQDWLHPMACYGYWPCLAEGEELILFDPQGIQQGERKELCRLSFPKLYTKTGPWCLADYFLPLNSPDPDLVALQLVSVGPQATKLFAELQSKQAYSEGYFVHGLAVQMAEASAQWTFDHICAELQLPPKQGRRYSWGYAALPEFNEHFKVFKLLPAEEALGISLSEAGQIIPEQSTAALFVHHPNASYPGAQARANRP